MIIVNLDVILAKRKISSATLAERVGITQANLSILKSFNNGFIDIDKSSNPFGEMLHISNNLSFLFIETFSLHIK